MLILVNPEKERQKTFDVKHRQPVQLQTHILCTDGDPALIKQVPISLCKHDESKLLYKIQPCLADTDTSREKLHQPVFCHHKCRPLGTSHWSTHGTDKLPVTY